MKSKFTFALIVFALSLVARISKAQTNHYFQNSPVWKVSSTCSIGGPCYRIDDSNYYPKGDTLIDSITYVRIFQVGQGHFDWQAPFPNPGCSGNYINPETTPSYFLRSDFKQMYIRFPGDSAEQLLYDFNLNVGDTLPVTYNNLYHDIVVSAVDSFLTPNGYYKRFALSGPTWSNYLIEGVGHSRGLAQPLRAPLECAYMLDCFGMQDSAYYPTSGPTCTIAIGINELKNQIPVDVYPNPFKQQTTFSFDASLKNVELKLHDVIGQTINYQYLEPSGKITLDRGQLNSGIYFFELLQNNVTKASGKLVIE